VPFLRQTSQHLHMFSRTGHRNKTSTRRSLSFTLISATLSQCLITLVATAS
jgi:hypothetical protein